MKKLKKLPILLMALLSFNTLSMSIGPDAPYFYQDEDVRPKLTWEDALDDSFDYNNQALEEPSIVQVYSSNNRAFIGSARRSSIRTLTQAARVKGIKKSTKNMYLRLAKKLKKVEIIYPKGRKELSICNKYPTARALVLRSGVRKIHICKRLIQKHNDPSEITQTLIHEAVHAIKITNECKATLISISAMVHAKKKVRKNGYMTNGRCPRLHIKSTL